MSLESAEMVKYASNTFLAMKISYANEMARICERVPGVDVSKVMAGVGWTRGLTPDSSTPGRVSGAHVYPRIQKRCARSLRHIAIQRLC
jgi:UDPglucose 6-dehydrogenase